MAARSLIFYTNRGRDFSLIFGRKLESYVKDFLDSFSGKVLVIGCGSGKEVKYLMDRGCDAYGFDFSPIAIHLAKMKYPEIKNHFFVDDLYNLNMMMSGDFNGIVANAVLLHLPERDDMTYILKMIRNRLKKDGLCFIRIIDKENVDEEIDDRPFNAQRWFVYYKENDIRKFADETGFLINDIKRNPHEIHNGVSWLSVLLKRID